MKVSLERLDARALRVELPGAGGDAIAVASASGLRGVLHHEDARLVLSDVAAESVELDALRLAFDTLVLSTESSVTLAGVSLALEQTETTLALDLGAISLAAAALAVAVDDVLVRGRAVLHGARLSVRGAEGSLSAARVELDGFSLRIGDVSVEAESLAGESVQIAWGAAGFRLVAASIAGTSLGVTAKDVRIDARGVAASALSVAEGCITLDALSADSAQTALVIASTSTSASATGVDEPLVDFRFLDALSGQLDVDVDVDVTVPIIGHRKATHRLRVPIAEGAIDYRALEKNLAKLEDALLDFSVRDGALVLERVNPLFPKRGHGKPIVVWDVDAADHELAERDRVRLAVLPRARLATSDDAPSGEPSAIALRSLALLRINTRLELAEVDRPLAGPLFGQLRPRHIASLVLGGNVFYEPGTAAPRDGALLGEAKDLAFAIVGLSLGTSRLDVGSFGAATVAPIELAFSGAAPKKIELGMTALRVEQVALNDHRAVSRP
ncbi:MAG: hypothetical protein JWP87_1839 [Labilithrix sp.]|nr:hypothetical protein [Labilithrix sp.]